MQSFSKTFRKKRTNQQIRDLFSQVSLQKNQLMTPLFVYEELTNEESLPHLAGQKRHSGKSVISALDSYLNKGLNNFLLFFIPKKKVKEKIEFLDFRSTLDQDVQVIQDIKKNFGQNIVLFSDICLCSQMVSGQCGILKNNLDSSSYKMNSRNFNNDFNNDINNDRTVQFLTEKALAYAEAGVDGVAPSDMMDDRILSFKNTFKQHDLEDTLIMSYSSKFSSQFYGPFRSVAESTPQAGSDRKSYQIDPRNPNDALSCARRDWEQGADILMVKPALTYLDIIYRIKNDPTTELAPLAAYHVSGEYQGLFEMEKAGQIQAALGLYEQLIAIKRAGADLIITYGAELLIDKKII